MVITAGLPIVEGNFWINKIRYSDAERKYYEKLAKLQKGFNVGTVNGDHDQVRVDTLVTKHEMSPRKKRKRNVSKGSPNNEVKEKAEENVLCPVKEKVEKSVESSIDQPTICKKKPEHICESKKSEQTYLAAKKIDYQCEMKKNEPLVDTKLEPSPFPVKRTDQGSDKKKHESSTQLKKDDTVSLKKVELVLEPNLKVETKDKTENVESEAPVSEGKKDSVKPENVITEEKKHGDDKRKKEKKRNKINKKDRRRSSQREDKGDGNSALCLNSLAGEVSKARQYIKNSLDCIDDIAVMASNNFSSEHTKRITQLEKDNKDLSTQVSALNNIIKKLEARISALEISKPQTQAGKVTTTAKAPPAKQVKDEEEDDDVDLFGSESEEEDEAAKKVKEQRLAEYAAKKSKKPALIAKSNVILDVKPWDDETDMKKMETEVRNISMDGLLWGASKLVPLAYGIHKLQISCVVEDDKVSIDLLTETIEEIQDYVQSVDIAAFNKI